jgi:hypothetical protein
LPSAKSLLFVDCCSIVPDLNLGLVRAVESMSSRDAGERESLARFDSEFFRKLAGDVLSQSGPVKVGTLGP